LTHHGSTYKTIARGWKDSRSWMKRTSSSFFDGVFSGDVSVVRWPSCMVGLAIFLSGDCGGVSNGVASLVGGGVESNNGDEEGDSGFFTEGDGGEGERAGDGERGEDWSGLVFPTPLVLAICGC